MAEGQSWAADAVIYQVYPRSFADGDGDGIGDLPGILERFDHFTDLGVDAIWLSPFYPSPGNDAGYDISDYRDVDPVFGTLADFDALIARAHAAGVRVIVDLVPNHTSAAHPWFQEALRAEAGDPARDMYVFRTGRDGGEAPPNNWTSVFGGPAWTRVEGSDDWYLHLFDPTQPDLNWENPAVREAFEGILRFWLDRGVDGFRVDVAHGLIKAEGLPDHLPAGEGDGALAASPTAASPFFDQDGVHDVYRAWRTVLDGYPGERILVAEAWVEPLSRLFRYVRADEMDQAFNFTFLMAGIDPVSLHRAVDETFAAAAEVGASPTWVMSNHDTVRHASRFGLPTPPPHQRGIGPADPQPDQARGRRLAAAMALVELGLPGSAYVYQGDELGLPEHTQLSADERRDPVFARSGGAELGRDGARTPYPWSGTDDHLGFGTRADAQTWLPQPESHRGLARDVQRTDADSQLGLYTELIALRRARGIGRGAFAWHALDDPGAGLLAFTSATATGAVLVLANLTAVPRALTELPAGEILAASHPDAISEGVLSADSAVWIALE
ncbi:glycoside hydrolase family 13 protein [Brevibacterium sp. XM4083]|uniref:glycoside hydrolase family 13 protein n=1 Tax=Brevibacterium sp. XM4083 TaxID=2583238 RepID=UPI0011292FB5|nr:glycoside hydrolase family 13 protein [Brevibacterium sp. XM4083]MCM1013417.1 glycoside hydrolase family 13 protein [Brevibacterium sp. XM4083]